MPAERSKLTQRVVADAVLPERGRRAIKDTVTPGLYVSVSHTGVKAFYWYGRVKGHPTRMCLGRFPEVSVDAARVEAKRIVGEAVSGSVPTPRTRAKLGEPTLRQAFESWMENHSVPHKRTSAVDRSRYNRHLAKWGARGLSQITREEVQSHHVKLGAESGPVAANLMLQLLTSIYRYADETLEWRGRSPAKGIKRFEQPGRERFLSEEEIVRFFKALELLRLAKTRDFFLLCLFTGARRSNIGAMEWAEIDFSAKIWTIPKEKSKNKKQMVLPLSENVVGILSRRKQKSTSKWVFPSHGKRGHYTWPKTAWFRLLEKANLKDLRIHDLRRTLASWQAMSGSSLLIISKSLGQSSTAATGIYSRLELESVRQSVQAANAAIENAAQKNTDS